MTCKVAPLCLAGREASPAVSAAGCCSHPLAGVSNRVFRGLVRRLSADALLFTEMVNATSLEMGHGLQKLAELELEPGPIGVQL